MRKPIYFFSSILLLLILVGIFTTKKVETNANLNITTNEIHSIYLKIPSINNDSIKLKTDEENYFINEWQKKELVGFWKGFPEYQIVLNYKSGITKKLRINAKDKKVSENEFIYELKDYGFFETIWKNKYYPNEPSTLEKMGIKLKKE